MVEPRAVQGGIQLHSGRIFSPLNPSLESFTLYDVIHGISGQPRFAFHTKVPYFVAQHCIIGTRWFLKRGMTYEAKCFFFHEGEEGLGLCDMPSPIKYLSEMDVYRNLGKTVQSAVFRKAGIYGTIPPIVKELDTALGAAEAKVLCRHTPQWSDIDTLGLVVKPYKNPFYAKKVMLQMFGELFPGLDLHE